MSQTGRVSDGQSLRGLQYHGCRHFVIEPPLPAEHILQGAPFEVLHDDERSRRLRNPIVEHPDEILAPKREESTCLPQESLPRISALEHFRPRHLHRHALSEVKVFRLDLPSRTVPDVTPTGHSGSISRPSGPLAITEDERSVSRCFAGDFPLLTAVRRGGFPNHSLLNGNR